MEIPRADLRYLLDDMPPEDDVEEFATALDGQMFTFHIDEGHKKAKGTSRRETRGSQRDAEGGDRGQIETFVRLAIKRAQNGG